MGGCKEAPDGSGEEPQEGPVVQKPVVQKPASPLPPGEVSMGWTIGNGRYTPTKMIGQGGFGKTFLGFENAEGWPKVVIKEFIPRHDSADAAKEQAMFRDEAQKLTQLGVHPQIPFCHGYFEERGSLFLTQDFIAGADCWVEACKNQVRYNEAMIWEL